MPLQHPDTTTRQHRRRAALGAALSLVLAPLLILGTITASTAADTDRTPRKKATRLVEPTSVTVTDTTCTALSDGTYDVTVTFKVTGGRYLNLGHPATSSAIVNSHGSVRYDNVRGGGTRYITATTHYAAFPGFDDDHTIATTGMFTYQHMIAPVTSQRKPVSLRTTRLLSRAFEVTFTCP